MFWLNERQDFLCVTRSRRAIIDGRFPAPEAPMEERRCSIDSAAIEIKTPQTV